MSSTNNNGSSELNNLLNDCISDMEEQLSVPSPEGLEVNEEAASDENKGKCPPFNFEAHLVNEDELPKPTDTQSLNIDAHISEEARAGLEEFTEINKQAPATEEKDNSSEDDEEVKKPIYIRILTKIAAFFWNSGFIIKAVVYIASVLVISAFLSYYIISVGNDVFSFVKTDHEVTIDIPEDITRKELSFLLKKNYIIDYDWAFELFMIYKDCDTDVILPGEHTFNSTMNYSQVIAELTEEKYERLQVSVTIPEGYTVDQIIDLLLSYGIGTREGFVDAINNYPFKHEFVQELEKIGYSESRKYRLEGYLYPDTYYFYTDSDEYIIINKMLNNFDAKFWSYYESTFKEDIEAEGLTFDDIITLASMIQAEAKYEIDFERISYVFHNRLSHKSSFPKLESDATIQYILNKHVSDLSQEQLNIDNPYNTYLYDGLPPGAICNPGFDAISAAIYPDAPLDDNDLPLNAYFFISNKAGTTYYSETLSGHNENKKQVIKDNAEYEEE